MRARSQRLWIIGIAGTLLIAATALALTAFQDSVSFFYSPSDVFEKHVAKDGQRARVGGLVQAGTVQRADNAEIRFAVTDGGKAVTIVYHDLLPDMFAEGKGIVAEGRFDAEGKLIASKLITKHDQDYMPKEVYDALKKHAPAGSDAARAAAQKDAGG